MYADRYGRTGIKPGALSIAIGLNGAILAALILSSPEILPRIPDGGFIIKDIPLPTDPPVEPEIEPEARAKPRTEQRTFDPPPPQHPVVFDGVKPDAGDFTMPSGPTGMDGGVSGGTGTIVEPYVPPHVPVLTGVELDQRYANVFQPAYPPSESRAGREGRVTVRVLVGVDGRVKQVELVSAASDPFYQATRRQALAKWRFKPATRDGIPQEGWRTMSVSFVLDQTD